MVEWATTRLRCGKASTYNAHSLVGLAGEGTWTAGNPPTGVSGASEELTNTAFAPRCSGTRAIQWLSGPADRVFHWHCAADAGSSGDGARGHADHGRVIASTASRGVGCTVKVRSSCVMARARGAARE